MHARTVYTFPAAHVLEVHHRAIELVLPSHQRRLGCRRRARTHPRQASSRESSVENWRRNQPPSSWAPESDGGGDAPIWHFARIDWQLDRMRRVWLLRTSENSLYYRATVPKDASRRGVNPRPEAPGVRSLTLVRQPCRRASERSGSGYAFRIRTHRPRGEWRVWSF